MSLPEKFSDLIELAVYDAQRFELIPGHSLNMRQWLFHCEACLAGAVMHQTLGLRGCRDVWRTGDAEDQLRALDSLRQGMLSSLAWELGLAMPEELLESVDDVVDDAFVPELQRAPWATYLKVAQMFREAGL